MVDWFHDTSTAFILSLFSFFLGRAMAASSRTNLASGNTKMKSSSSRHQAVKLSHMRCFLGLLIIALTVLSMITFMELHIQLEMSSQSFKFSIESPHPPLMTTTIASSSPEFASSQQISQDNPIRIIREVVAPGVVNESQGGSNKQGGGLENEMSTQDAKPGFISTLPPLSSLVNDRDQVIGNVQFLLDVAVVGFSRTATTAVKQALSAHPGIQPMGSDHWDLVQDRPATLVRSLYENYARDRKGMNNRTTARLHGSKCSIDLNHAHAINWYRKLFPQTKLIVITRNPVEWFQSLYNSRITRDRDEWTPLKHPNALRGICTRGTRNVCTHKSNYAHYLIQLGKQHFTRIKPTSSLERSIVNQYKNLAFDPAMVPYMPNEIFLMDVEQLKDTNLERRKQLRHDLASFLGLGAPIPEFDFVLPSRSVRNAPKIDLCEDQYLPVRKDLMNNAHWAAEWITQEFLTYPGVHVSNQTYLEKEVLNQYYTKDPCVTGRMATNVTNPRSADSVSAEELRMISNATMNLFLADIVGKTKSKDDVKKKDVSHTVDAYAYSQTNKTSTSTPESVRVQQKSSPAIQDAVPLNQSFWRSWFDANLWFLAHEKSTKT